MTKNTYFGPNLVFFFDINPNIFGSEQKFWYQNIGEPIRHLFVLGKLLVASLRNIDQQGLNALQWAARDENVQFLPQNLDILYIYYPK